MSKKTPQAIRGTQDIFGADAEAFAFVVETFERVRKLYRFRRVEMPVFEKTEVFARSIGETTDIVSKEMYSFDDRGGESLTLRPEFTAGIARAYLTNGWQQHAPLKVGTHGPLFRYERPQKGRYRQFHQIDAEIIGAAEPEADVELLAMADQLLKELGIEGVTLHLNTLGDAESRDAWRAALVEHFRAVKGELSEDSQERLEKNPLRILDSKDRRDQRFVADAPKIDAFLVGRGARVLRCGDQRARRGRRDMEARRKPRARARLLSPHRVRIHPGRRQRSGGQAGGRKAPSLGGGRYDGLMESLGGPATPAVGWAAGIERLAMLVGEKGEASADVIVVVKDDSAQAMERAWKAACLLRNEDFSCELVSSGSVKKRWDKAVKKEPKVILGFDAEGSDWTRDAEIDQRLIKILGQFA